LRSIATAFRQGNESHLSRGRAHVDAPAAIRSPGQHGSGEAELLRKAIKAEAPVIFFINGIGDNILNLPALRALGALFAGRLSLICSRGVAVAVCRRKFRQFFSNCWWSTVAEGETLDTNRRTVSADYFQTLGLQLVRGRKV
jgi:hypothetical protein